MEENNDGVRNGWTWILFEGVQDSRVRGVIPVLYGRVTGVSVSWFYHVWTSTNAPNENFSGRGGGLEAFGGSAMGAAVYGRVA